MRLKESYFTSGRRFFPVLAALSFLTCFAPASYANVQSTITICDTNLADGGCYRIGDRPSPKYATCQTSRYSYDFRTCRAKPGYVFWVGECAIGRYLQTGQIGNGLHWCARKDY